MAGWNGCLIGTGEHLHVSIYFSDLPTEYCKITGDVSALSNVCLRFQLKIIHMYTPCSQDYLEILVNNLHHNFLTRYHILFGRCFV